jgi:hypothetical protein
MRKTALLAVLTGLLILTGAGTASAGGPTSVMIVQPDTGRAAALHLSNPSYNVLSDLLKATPRLTDTKAGPDAHSSGQAVRLTWLIHDVQVWRVDEVYADAPGGPWIATRESWDGDPLEKTPVWHRSAQPERLVQLLKDLKVLDAAAPVVQYEPPVVQDDAGTVAADVTSPATAEPARVTLDGWRWIVPGVLGGVLLTYLAVRLSPAWQRRETGPRVELVDETER